MTLPVKHLKKETAFQRLWVLLSLTAVELAYVLVTYYGNYVGIDEWTVLYQVSRGTTVYPENSERFVGLLHWMISYKLVGPGLLGNYIFYLLLKIAAAYVLFLLIEHFSSGKSAFAFSCSVIYLVYTIYDWNMLYYYQYLGRIGHLLVTLLALYFYFKAVRHNQISWLFAAIAMAFLSIFNWETSLPLLVGIPVLAFALLRDYSRSSFYKLVIWSFFIVLFGLWFALPILGLAPATYGSHTFTTFSLSNIIRLTRKQFRWLLYGLAHYLRPDLIQPHRLPLLIVLVSIWGSIKGFQKVSQTQPSESESEESIWYYYPLWVVIGLITTWLGFSAFLISSYGEYVTRVHFLSSTGFALALGSVIWGVRCLARNHLAKQIVLYAGLTMITVIGITKAGGIQESVYCFKTTWERHAVFLRSLAYVAPAPEENTLFILVESPDSPSPFACGWAFEYALRYLYDDTVTGFISTENLLGKSWNVSNEGIAIESTTLSESSQYKREISFHRWDEIVFISVTDDWEVHILETIPSEYHSQARMELYDPYARLDENAFIPEPVQQLVPNGYMP
jgi:hypothetical protein